jgi:hypothetical protein
MHGRFRILAVALAVALTMCVSKESTAWADQPMTLAEAGTEGSQDDGAAPAEDNPEPSGEGQAAAEDDGRDLGVPLGLGVSRRLDPSDAADDAPRAPHPAALAYPDHDVVVCEAGCDKTAGSVVYMKKRQ